jgi:hypothetical protein
VSRRVFVISARFTRKNVENAVEDQANLGAFEAESYIIGNPGKGFAFEQRQQAGYVKQAEAQRLYRGLEIILSKRLSNNYYYSLNYTYNRLERKLFGIGGFRQRRPHLAGRPAQFRLYQQRLYRPRHAR